MARKMLFPEENNISPREIRDFIDGIELLNISQSTREQLRALFDTMDKASSFEPIAAEHFLNTVNRMVGEDGHHA